MLSQIIVHNRKTRRLQRDAFDTLRLAIFVQSEILGRQGADCDAVPKMRIVSNAVAQGVTVVVFACQRVKLFVERDSRNQNLA